MTHELTPETLAELKAQNLTDAQIARRYGIGVRRVRRLREKHGIASSYRRPAEGVDLAERYHQLYPIARHLREVERLTYREIGEQIGVKESTVASWLRGRKFKGKVYNVDDGLRIVFDYIVWFKHQHNGNSPTSEEIADGTGYAPATVRRFVGLLVDADRITVMEEGRLLRFEIKGSQWLPPTGVKVPATPRSRPRQLKPRKDKVKRLAKAGRLCDCGQEAHWYVDVRVGSAIKEGGRSERMPLCDECVKYEQKAGSDVKRFGEGD